MKVLPIVASAVVLQIVTALVLIPLTDRARVLPTDFVNFYMGASIVARGQGPELYQRQTQDASYEQLLHRESNQYFLHPAYEAAALSPLTHLPLEQAFVLWTLINVGVLSLLPLLLINCVPLINAKPCLGMLVFCLLPCLTALTLGQDSIILLFVISLTYLLLSRNRDLAAGFVLSLATIKFQYVLVLLPLLLLSRRFRLGAGFALGCSCLAVLSFWVTGWHGFVDYFNFLRAFQAHAGYGSMQPALMANARGFAAGMEWSAQPFVLVMQSILIGLGVAAAWASGFRRSDGLTFALFLMISLGASPYAHFPDLTVAFLPIVLVVDHLGSVGLQSNIRKILLSCCIAMFLLPYALLLLGGHYWWNSRIYWMFPVQVLFIFGLTAEVFAFRGGAHPKSDGVGLEASPEAGA